MPLYKSHQGLLLCYSVNAGFLTVASQGPAGSDMCAFSPSPSLFCLLLTLALWLQPRWPLCCSSDLAECSCLTFQDALLHIFTWSCTCLRRLLTHINFYVRPPKTCFHKLQLHRAYHLLTLPISVFANCPLLSAY